MKPVLRLPKSLITFALLYMLTTFLSPYASAQLSRSERKAWKKEIKKLSPERLKQMIEEKQQLLAMLNILQNEKKHLQTDIFEKDQKIAFLKSDTERLRESLKTREIQMGLINENGERWDSGVVFKVQIGALNRADFLNLNGTNYTLEIEEGGPFLQYVIGNFRNYKEADALKKQMRKVGMTKAWIVPYKNGRRVPLKDVLDYVLDK